MLPTSNLFLLPFSGVPSAGSGLQAIRATVIFGECNMSRDMSITRPPLGGLEPK